MSALRRRQLFDSPMGLQRFFPVTPLHMQGPQFTPRCDGVLVDADHLAQDDARAVQVAFGLVVLDQRIEWPCVVVFQVMGLAMELDGLGVFLLAP